VRRSWFIAAVLLGVVAIAIAALAMRLSEDDGNPSTTEWADAVCTDLATWKTSIESLADVSGGTLTAETLSEKIDTAQEATQTLVTELEGLGPPDLESGDELQQQLSSSADELRSSFESLQQAAEQAAQAGAPAEFLQGLTALAPQFQALLDAVQATVDDLRNANLSAEAKTELQAAFDGSQSCQELRGNG
jgi:hypothetical protein